MNAPYVVECDDSVHRVRRELIDLQGTTMPVILTIATWGLILGPGLSVALLSRFTGSDWSSAFMVGGITGLVTAYFVVRQLNSDVGLLGLLQAEVTEFRIWCQDRADAVREKNAARSGLLRVDRKVTR